MPALEPTPRFSLTEVQHARLAALRAGLDEGERRFEFWTRRADQAQAAAEFADLLTGSGLGAGRRLVEDTRARLLGAAAKLAPNGNLSRRLFAADARGFDTRLRELLLGHGSLAERIEVFLAVRGTGAQTASALLCASAPDTYPLITSPALRRLALTPVQKRAALEDAAERYGFLLPESGPAPAAHTLLALFVVYEAVRDALRLPTYPEVNSALRSDLPPGFVTTPAPAAAVVREGSPAYTMTPSPALTETRLLAALEDYALGQGFTFPAHRLRSYYVALKTRPFVLLSGVSGTGKTRLAELLAESLTGHNPTQFRLLPVRPDWNDSTALFGYQNLLANRYVGTPFLEIARMAARPENRRRAFFVCLDEMNLARAEQYLADYLSALESRARRVPLGEGVPDLVLPPNLFVTGTVNVDETTHGFSRKVLDRANTLEFDEPPDFSSVGAAKGYGILEDDLGGIADSGPARRQALFLAARVSGVGQARERLARIAPDLPARALALLEEANTLLYPRRLHFAYRVRDDVLMYLANSFDADINTGLFLPDIEANFTLALDLQILQKVLPKLHGQAEDIAPLLTALESWAERHALGRTASKLARMRATGTETGYVRFYE